MGFRSSYAQLISYQLSVISYQLSGKWGNGEMGKWGNGEMGKFQLKTQNPKTPKP